MPSVDVAYVTLVRVRAEFRALHRWSAAPPEVGFLANWHRHVFKVTLTVTVTHSDRDVEFFILQKKLREYVAQWEGKEVDKSCEMFAEDLLAHFSTGYTVHDVMVSEDGENEAVLGVLGRSDEGEVDRSLRTMTLSWND